MLKKINKLIRNFLWAPEEEAKGGKCLVSWRKVCAPRSYGGLGIKDLQAFSRALRLRWELFRWAEQDRPWKGTPTPCDDSDKTLFAACTTIHVGNGEIARFWSDKWLNGQAPHDIAPLLPALAVRKNLTVKEALTNGRWMRGLHRIGTEEQLTQFLLLWECIQGVNLNISRDTIE